MPPKKPASAPERSPALQYTGDPSGQPHISGIPSRDLSADEVPRLAHQHGMTVAEFVAMATRGPFIEE
jgi:hypothetical protein